MAKLHLLIVEARFYADLADELVAGAIDAIEAAGGTWERVEVPGALEIPAAISQWLMQAPAEPMKAMSRLAA